jgi:hypothetical protein
MSNGWNVNEHGGMINLEVPVTDYLMTPEDALELIEELTEALAYATGEKIREDEG